MDGRVPDVFGWIATHLPRFRYRKLDQTFYSYVDVDLAAQQRELAEM